MWIKKMEEDKKKVVEIFKIVSIYLSNSLRDGLKIKRSRFNHSCRPNTFEQHGTNEIRAGSNIKPGQEITVNYAGTKLLFNMLSGKHKEALSTLVESLVQITCSDLTNFFKLAEFAKKNPVFSRIT